MQLTVEQVRHVAKLARLSLLPGEDETYRAQLSAILNSMEVLNELDTSTVPPTSHAVPTAAVMRADVPSGELTVEQALANAPSKASSCFVLPKVIE